MSGALPPELVADLQRARRLEWWTLAWMGSVVVVMWLAMGSSQAMRTALIEDVLSLVPAIVFLIACRLEGRPATHAFPHGFLRVHSLGFLISAVALSAVGAILLIESTMTLLAQDHATIPPIALVGQSVWMGWLMVAALIYSVVPPIILGRMKQPIARRLQDKVLHTDAMMQKADWMTGLAGVAGVIGLGLGYWWADAAAAVFISGSILRDGIVTLRASTAELIDGAPRALESDEVAEDAEQLRQALTARYPDADIRLRETGRFIGAQVAGVAPDDQVRVGDVWPGAPDRSWRLAQISFVPPDGETKV